MSNKDNRRYTHHCPLDTWGEVNQTEEVCPKCGQAGKRNGWFRGGMFGAMGRFQRLYGLPPTGIHLRFLPLESKKCERCGGEGMLEGAGGEDDVECPDCKGLERILTRSGEEMGKIQRWALARHERSRHEEEREWEKKRIPKNLVLARDPDYFVEAIMAMVNDEKENGKRNDRIGELMMLAHERSWNFLMELIEKWEKLGGELAVRKNEIWLCLPLSKGTRLVSLAPGGSNGDGAATLRWEGLEKFIASKKRIQAYQEEVGRIAPGMVKRGFRRMEVKGLGLEEAWMFLRAMRRLCRI